MPKAFCKILAQTWQGQADHLQCLSRRELEILWHEVQEHRVNFDRFHLAVYSDLWDRYVSEAQASVLGAFWAAMEKGVPDREAQSLGVIRLPSALLQEVKDKLEFRIGIQKAPEELITRYIDLHKGIVRRIEDEVRGFIRKAPVLKTGLARKMITSQKLQFLLDAEVSAAMACMIQERVIRYEAGKLLALSGE